MKYYSQDVFAVRAARNAVGTASKFLFVEEVKAVYHENPKYERGAAKRGGNWCAMIVLDHEKTEVSKDDVKALKGFDVIFDPQGTPESREERRAATEAGTRVIRTRSSVENPVEKVWQVCDDNPEFTRKEIINYCVEMGISKNTASTQYAKWRKENTASE